MIDNDIFRQMPLADGTAIRTIDSPVSLAGCEKVAPRQAPNLGQHSDQILGELGYNADEIAALRASGAVA